MACLDHNCDSVQEHYGRPKTLVVENDTLLSTLLGYNYVVNIFTGTGMRDSVPFTMGELLVSGFMALFSQFMIANMASGFANMVIIDKNIMVQYEQSIYKMKIYLSVS